MKHLKPYHDPPLAPLGELFHQQIVAGPKVEPVVNLTCEVCNMTFSHQGAMNSHRNFKHGLPNRTIDVCANRHRGNPESRAAFNTIKDRLTAKQERVFLFIKRSMPIGATVDELALALDVTPNAISGRVTELKIKGLVEKRGRRRTRSGCMASVIVAK